MTVGAGAGGTAAWGTVVAGGIDGCTWNETAPMGVPWGCIGTGTVREGLE